MLLSLVALSLAQDTETVQESPVYAAETHIEFGYTRVDGKLVGPDGVLINERPRPEFNPLIELRLNFDEEMDHSVGLVK